MTFCQIRIVINKETDTQSFKYNTQKRTKAKVVDGKAKSQLKIRPKKKINYPIKNFYNY